jgi:hypothetical protein
MSLLYQVSFALTHVVRREQEIQALVADKYKVDVHLHTFVPVPLRTTNSSSATAVSPAPPRTGDQEEGGGEAEEGQECEDAVGWEWKIDSLYPSATLPTGSMGVPPDRPFGALHLCLCGNHMWAAPFDSDLWEVNDIDLRTFNYDPLTDQEYDALPQEEKDLVVHWDRHKDPVVKMFIDDELPANYTNDAYEKVEIDDRSGVLEKALKDLLDDEDPYWLYMWNETFKAGLKWGNVGEIEMDNETGAPVQWTDPELFDWAGYIEFRRQEDARLSLVYADGTSPQRRRQDVEASILKLEQVYQTKFQELLVAEQAVAAGLNVSGQPLQSRRESLEILAQHISECKAQLESSYPPVFVPSANSNAAERDKDAGGDGGGIDWSKVSESDLSDEEILRLIAQDLGGTLLNVDDLQK